VHPADEATRALTRRALGGDLAAARAVAARLADRARIDTRLYATEEHTATKGLQVALLGRLGAEVVTSTATARLVAAAGREPGLGWSRRLDCLVRA
jgi:hypothetical protein